ncbi:MAG: substrate-binding domain-containing protein [Akkermansiaceae bacterium]
MKGRVSSIIAHQRRVGLRIPRWAAQNTIVVNGIVKFLRESKQDWIIDADIETDRELPPNIIDKNWTGNGLIVFRCSEDEAAAWLARGIPVVNISTETNIKGVPNVIPNNYQMGKLAAQHMMDLGLRKFLYIGESLRRYSRLRQQGFEETLEAAGFVSLEIDLKISEMPEDRKSEILHEQLNKQLGVLELPTGVLARDDIVAMNVLRSTRSLGINVPSDMALIGINDSSPYCHVATPKLTSVRHPGMGIGFHAARVLDGLMNGEKQQGDTLLDSSGISERESSNIIAVEDELVSEVLKYMRLHGKTEAVNIAAMCRAFGISSTTLRIRFKEAIGHSAKEELSRIRHKVASQLLVETAMSVQEIAYDMGFNSPEELTRFFTRHEKISPTQFRAATQKRLGM